MARLLVRVGWCRSTRVCTSRGWLGVARHSAREGEQVRGRCGERVRRQAGSVDVRQRRGRACVTGEEGERGGRREEKKKRKWEKEKEKEGREREEKGERDGEIRAAIAALVSQAQRRLRVRTRPQGSGRGLEIGHLEQREIPENRVRGLWGF